MTRHKDAERQQEHLVSALLNLPLFQNHREIEWTFEERQDIEHTVDALWKQLSENATPTADGGLKPGNAQSFQSRYHADAHAERQPHQQQGEASNDR